MKFCPYCGAHLQDSAAPFCSECGQKLQTLNESDKVDRKEKKRLPFFRKRKRTKPAENLAKAEPEPSTDDSSVESEDADRNYDGYYEDILPTDLGRKREPVDRSLVIKILLLCAGVFLIISACVVALYLL